MGWSQGWALRFALAASVALMAGCGADSTTSSGRAGTSGGGAGGSHAGGASAATGGTGGTAGKPGGAGACARDADCGSGEVCSAAKSCIAKGSCETDADCGQGEMCDDRHACVPGSGCGAEEFMVEPVDANVLIVLDRSCSMKKQGDPSGKTKWQLAVGAINMATAKFADHIRWGLILFPDLTAPDCDQTPGPPHIPVGDGNDVPIQTLLTNALLPSDVLYPDGPCVTNIDTAIVQASADPALRDPDRGSYVLLATDGQQSDGCGGNAKDPDTEAAISSMAALDIGTFVIGFGQEADLPQLDRFAQLGGHPNPDPASDFYPATDQASLEAALDAIASSVIGCEYALPSAPEKVDELYVFLDNKPVDRDTTRMNGWDYDEATMQVRFFGAPCDGLRDGSLTDIDVVYGCPMPTPE